MGVGRRSEPDGHDPPPCDERIDRRWRGAATAGSGVIPSALARSRFSLVAGSRAAARSRPRPRGGRRHACGSGARSAPCRASPDEAPSLAADRGGAQLCWYPDNGMRCPSGAGAGKEVVRHDVRRRPAPCPVHEDRVARWPRRTFGPGVGAPFFRRIMKGLEIRPLRAGETDLFLSYPYPSTPEVGYEARRSYAESGWAERVSAWAHWVALRDGAVVARAAWWTGPDDDLPEALDWLEAGPGPDQVELGSLRWMQPTRSFATRTASAPTTTSSCPPDCRIGPMSSRRPTSVSPPRPMLGCNCSWSVSAIATCPRRTVSSRSARLVFRLPMTRTCCSALRSVLDGTLDAYSRRDIATTGRTRPPRSSCARLHGSPLPESGGNSPTTLPIGSSAIIRPATTLYRRSGISESSAAARSRLCERPAGRDGVASGRARARRGIGADTDVRNEPMARAFARAGFRNVAARMVMTERGMG